MHENQTRTSLKYELAWLCESYRVRARENLRTYTIRKWAVESKCTRHGYIHFWVSDDNLEDAYIHAYKVLIRNHIWNDRERCREKFGY